MIENFPTYHSNVLELNRISKKFFYKLADTRKHGLKEILRSIRGASKNRIKRKALQKGEFWAVRDVSFSLNKGETLGIIGLNGAGKSTILKMISGQYMPDDGDIKIIGSVGSLIDLQAGFHPMFTGRENIYIKGAMMGKTKEQIDEMYHEIVGFAEIGKFIDSPIKTYSSGMQVRLGFSVAVHIDPDLLLMDEVLAVGDFRFQQKCLDRVNRIRQQTATIFISHSMTRISMFCDQVIVLDKGTIAYKGAPDDAIKFYMTEIDNANKKIEGLKAEVEKDLKPFYGELFVNEDKINNVVHYWADKHLNPIDTIETGHELNLVIQFTLSDRPKKELIIGVPIWDISGNLITSAANDMDGFHLQGDENNFYNVILNFPRWELNQTKNISVVAVVDGVEYYYRQLNKSLITQNFKRNQGFVTTTHRWKEP